MVCVHMCVHLPGPSTAYIVSGLAEESGHIGSFVPCAMCLDWPVFTEAFLGAPWPNWLSVGTLLRREGGSPRCQWGCWLHEAMLGVLCFHSLPSAFLASGTGHLSPFVCAQDGTLRLWEYRSGFQLQCCDLASLQEPTEHQGHKVTSCSTLVLELSLLLL